MHSNLSETLALLDTSRASLRDAVAAIPAPLRRQRPVPNRWSAVEIVEHLGLVEKRFAGMLAPTIDEAVTRGLGPENTGREPLPSSVGHAIGDRSATRMAPDVVQPSGNLDEAAAWKTLEQARSALLELLMRGDGLALSTVVHAHPFFGPLNVYQWGELIAGHESRHTQQLRELAAQLPVDA